MSIELQDMRNWSHVVAIKAGPERFRRPEVPVRATFDSLVETWGRVRDRSVVPIEAAHAGDQQVVAASYPGEMNIPVISLDSLGAVPSVTSIVAGTMIEAKRPLPSVREVLLLADVIVPDEPTLRTCAQLESLFALLAPSDRKLALSALPAHTLLRLAVSRACFGPLESLRRFTALQELIVNSCRPGDSLQAFSALTELRHFRVYGGPLKGWRALRHCTKLERAHLVGFRAPDLRGFSGWTRLRQLTITQRGLQSLAGIESLVALQELHLFLVRIGDLAPLRGHPELSSVSLMGAKDIHDLTALGDLPTLRRFECTQAGVEDSGMVHLASLRPLGRCEALEEVLLKGAIVDDGDLSAIQALPKLRRVWITFDDGRLSKAVDQLRRARPEVDVYYRALGGIPGQKIGEVAIHPPAPGIGMWWIRDDLAERLGVVTNYDAESRLCETLAAEQPGLLKRLSFDTEASAVVVEAESEEDIRAVADLVGRLTCPR